ncbi:MAG: DUF2628 domain-containing protein [Rickettsiales bacterium]|nr:DUF2628 domain-containing protein [Rickettsiales bacterium]
MKLYATLIEKNKEGKISDAVLLKEGFSFFAFLFGPFWFFYHKMWQEFFVLLALNIGLGLFGEFDKILLEVALASIVALNANYWFGEHLKKKNYEFVGLVFGSDLTNAKLRFAANFGADISAFDDSILNPKLHRKMRKLKKLAA